MNRPTVVFALHAHNAPWAQRPARLLATLGHADTASDESAYLAQARAWAAAPPTVHDRQTLIDAGLTDPARFARHFSDAIVNAYYGMTP